LIAEPIINDDDEVEHVLTTFIHHKGLEQGHKVHVEDVFPTSINHIGKGVNKRGHEPDGTGGQNQRPRARPRYIPGM